MTRETPLTDIACPFCSILCDDLELTRVEGSLRPVNTDCPLARDGFARAGPPTEPPRVSGRAADLATAAGEAARLLAKSRLPLFAGMAADVAGQRALLALADRSGGTVDHLRSPGLFRNLLALMDGGAVLTTLSEARNRADFVLVIGPDPRRTAPRLFERLLAPGALFLDAKVERAVVFLCGEAEAPLPQGVQVERIPAPLERVAEIMAALRVLVAGRSLPAPAVAGVPAERFANLAQRLKTARYGVAVWTAAEIGMPHADLAIQAMMELIKDLNAETRFAALPLAGPDGVVGAHQAMLWQSGVPLRSAFLADGPLFDPWLHDGGRILAAGEADLLLWTSAFAPLPPPAGDRPTVALTAPGTGFAREPEVVIPVGIPGIDHGGTLFRTDTVVAMPIAGPAPRGLPSVADVAEAILSALAKAVP